MLCILRSRFFHCFFLSFSRSLSHLSLYVYFYALCVHWKWNIPTCTRLYWMYRITWLWLCTSTKSVWYKLLIALALYCIYVHKNNGTAFPECDENNFNSNSSSNSSSSSKPFVIFYFFSLGVETTKHRWKQLFMSVFSACMYFIFLV